MTKRKALRDEGIALLRSVTRLEAIYIALRHMALGKLIPDAGEQDGLRSRMRSK